MKMMNKNIFRMLLVAICAAFMIPLSATAQTCIYEGILFVVK